MAATTTTKHHVLVVGGAGFLGSAITKRLLSQGHTVTSMSPSGRPFLTPSGHRPAWSSSTKIRWAAADAFTPSTYRRILSGEDLHPSSVNSSTPVTAIVSTIGVLLEANYKGSNGSWDEIRKVLMKGWGLEKSNPLAAASSSSSGMYEKMNRDAVLSIAQTFLETKGDTKTPTPFVFISAEDIFRPIIDSRYISTKREAEVALEKMSWSTSTGHQPPSILPDADGAGLSSELNTSPTTRLLRPTFLRPGLMYHPHTRPLSTLPSAFLDLSATVHANVPSFLPTPAGLLNSLGQDSLARLLTHSPLHIDTVAKAASEAIAREDVCGAVGIDGIKRLAGWKDVDGREAQGTTSTSRPWPTQSVR